MANITLDKILSGYNLAKINENFERVQNAINNYLLHADGYRALSQDLDVNGQALLNVGDLEIQGVSVLDGVTQLTNEYNELKEQANELITSMQSILAKTIESGSVDELNIGNVQAIATATNGYVLGTILTLPYFYTVGKNTLRFSVDGVQWYKGDGYNEIGNVGEQSNQIVLLKSINVGSVYEEWVDASNDFTQFEQNVSSAAEMLQEYNPDTISAFTSAYSNFESYNIQQAVDSATTTVTNLYNYNQAAEDTLLTLQGLAETINSQHSDVVESYQHIQDLYSQLLVLQEQGFDLEEMNDQVTSLVSAVEDAQTDVGLMSGYAASGAFYSLACSQYNSSANINAVNTSNYLRSVYAMGWENASVYSVTNGAGSLCVSAMWADTKNASNSVADVCRSYVSQMDNAYNAYVPRYNSATSALDEATEAAYTSLNAIKDTTSTYMEAASLAKDNANTIKMDVEAISSNTMTAVGEYTLLVSGMLDSANSHNEDAISNLNACQAISGDITEVYNDVVSMSTDTAANSTAVATLSNNVYIMETSVAGLSTNVATMSTNVLANKNDTTSIYNSLVNSMTVYRNNISAIVDEAEADVNDIKNLAVTSIAAAEDTAINNVEAAVSASEDDLAGYVTQASAYANNAVNQANTASNKVISANTILNSIVLAEQRVGNSLIATSTNVTNATTQAALASGYADAAANTSSGVAAISTNLQTAISAAASAYALSAANSAVASLNIDDVTQQVIDEATANASAYANSANAAKNSTLTISSAINAMSSNLTVANNTASTYANNASAYAAQCASLIDEAEVYATSAELSAASNTLATATNTISGNLNTTIVNASSALNSKIAANTTAINAKPTSANVSTIADARAAVYASANLVFASDFSNSVTALNNSIAGIDVSEQLADYLPLATFNTYSATTATAIAGKATSTDVTNASSALNARFASYATTTSLGSVSAVLNSKFASYAVATTVATSFTSYATTTTVNTVSTTATNAATTASSALTKATTNATSITNASSALNGSLTAVKTSCTNLNTSIGNVATSLTTVSGTATSALNKVNSIVVATSGTNTNVISYGVRDPVAMNITTTTCVISADNLDMQWCEGLKKITAGADGTFGVVDGNLQFMDNSVLEYANGETYIASILMGTVCIRKVGVEE